MKRFTTLAVLLALGVTLQWVESALMLPALLPGAKLGLANVATLLVLSRYGGGAAAAFGIIRHLVASLPTGGWLLPTFWLGMGGSSAAAFITLAAGQRLNLRTVGVLSGAGFQVGQSLALVGVTATPEMIAYLPPLIALGVGAGWLTGWLAETVERRLQGPGRAEAPGRERLVAAVLLGVALVAGFTLRPPVGRGRQAVVTVGGQERLRIDLAKDGEYDLVAGDGHLRLEVAGGRIRVVESDCPDGICVLTGWIDRPGRPIYCAPYRTLVTVTGGSGEIDGLLQ